MGKIFLTIAGTVVVLNIISLLIPDGKYEKYVQFVAGLIVLLTIAGGFFHLQVNHAGLNFDEGAFEFESAALENELERQITEESLKEKIEAEIGVSVNLTVFYNEHVIEKVEIQDCGDKNTQITDIIIQYCDINRDAVVIK